MVASSRIIAASSLIAISFAAPLASLVERNSLVERKSFAGYKVYGGDGTVAQGWPSEDDWLSFDELWTLNQPVMKSSCAQFNAANNSPGEIEAIKKAIQEGSKKSGVASQYILTAMMQESKGCVRAPTTNYGVRNPGLMQSFNGKGTCNEGGEKNPCPDQTIAQMVLDGTGEGLEFGIKQAIAKSGSSGVDKYYKAARIYNSGSIDASGNLGAGIATHCYSTDMANRLLGWTSEASGCQEGSIGSVGGGSSSGGSTPKEGTKPKEGGNQQVMDDPTANTPAAPGGAPSPSGNAQSPAGAAPSPAGNAPEPAGAAPSPAGAAPTPAAGNAPTWG